MGIMKPDETTDERGLRRPRNKANMSEPQEEFIEPESSHTQRSHPDHDVEHGDELQYATHSSVWERGYRAA